MRLSGYLYTDKVQNLREGGGASRNYLVMPLTFGP